MKAGKLFSWIGAMVLALATPSMAQADWAYTHWGMKPGQVAAASAGAVKVLPADKRTRFDAGNWELAAEGTHVDDTIKLQVGFQFDTRSGGLECVLYNVMGSGDVEKLQSLLTKRYGKPVDTSSYGPTQTSFWVTPDKVEMTIGQTPVAAVVSHCMPNQE